MSILTGCKYITLFKYVIFMYNNLITNCIWNNHFQKINRNIMTAWVITEDKVGIIKCDQIIMMEKIYKDIFCLLS